MIELRKVHLDPYLLQHALRFPGEAFVQLPVGWTLRVEAMFSIFLPVLMLVATRAHWLILVMASIPALTLEYQSTYDYLRFSLDFSFGIAIYCERVAMSRLFARVPALVQFMVLTLGVVLLSSPVYFMLDGRNPVRALVLYCCGATVIVLCSLHIEGLRRALSRPFMGWIGRMSFSVYLVHFPVIIMLTPFVDHRLNFWEASLFVVASLLGSYSIAPLLYKGVEEPCIRAGHWARDQIAGLHQSAK